MWDEVNLEIEEEETRLGIDQESSDEENEEINRTNKDNSGKKNENNV